MDKTFMNKQQLQLPSPIKTSFPAFLASFAFVILVVLIYTRDPLNFSGDRSLVIASSPKSSSDTKGNQQQLHVLTDMIRWEKKVGLYSEEQLRKKLNIEEKIPFAVGRRSKRCDVFSGKWVHDNVSYPLYKEDSCIYDQPQLRCQAQGRPDSDYQQWRWQPHQCNLPRFNSTFMLEALRGKRLVYVGDSLNRGQFLSMVCLLQSVIPDQRSKSIQHNASLLIFTAKEYNASIEFYWAPLLLESNGDDPNHHKVKGRTVRPNSVSKHGEYWKGADILVFDSYVWWMTGKKIKILTQGSIFEEDDQNHDMIELDANEAFRLGLEDMARWVDENMDPLKTRVFFTTMSPLHPRSDEWGGEKRGNCYNETSLIDIGEYWSFTASKIIMQVVHDVFSEVLIKVPITILNITQLSLYRKDAHTSIYKPQSAGLTQEQLDNPSSYADCVHWCIPGVPDTWNELFYTKLFYA